MATSHGLSVYVNSCVKNPLDPKTGQRITFAERSPEVDRLAATDPGPVTSSNGYFGGEGGEFRRYAEPAVRTSLENVEVLLKNLTDDQFYVKLQELKEANRKTLEECEKLLKEKYGGDEEKGSQSAKEMVERMFAARLAERTAERSRHVSDEAAGVGQNDIANRTAHCPLDSVKDMSAKPPPAPYSSKGGPRRSTTLPERSAGFGQRPSSVPSYTQLQRRAYSLDNEDWRRAMCDDLSDNDAEDEQVLEPELSSAISKIRDMWQNFTVEDYSRARRHSSASMSKDEKKDKWRHKITIPKPFQMTLRDEFTKKKKTKAQIELEQKRLEKQLEEEAECQKKFHAQPAPSHIYLPLYDELREKNEARRRYIKSHTKELLNSLAKPFNFDKREAEKKEQRRRETTVAERIARSQEKKEKQQFKANPIPPNLFSDCIEEQLLEKEYRKIRMKLRAKETMLSSSLFPNMLLQQKLKEEKEKQKMMEAKKKSQSKCRPKSAHDVPDYDLLYREFQKELARRKETKEGTVVEPFALETNKRQSNREKVMRDMEKDTQALKENRWPFQSTTPHSSPRALGGLATSLDSIPFKSTNSADRRKEFLRTQKEREQRAEELRQEEEHRREMRQAKLRKYITEHSSEPTHRNYVKNRLKQYKTDEKKRSEQYEKDLEDMQQRVQKRPLLFEQETQASAGRAAEKKFQTTLKNAGIDEDFVQTPSSRSTHIPTSEDEDSADATYDKDQEELA